MKSLSLNAFAIFVMLATNVSSIKACSLTNGGRPPLIGAIVHTEYTSQNPHHWGWFQRSFSYVHEGLKPSLGFYNQDSSPDLAKAHYKQLSRASVDYALFSWYGSLTWDRPDNSLQTAMQLYWEAFAVGNQRQKSKIRLAVLVEFATRATIRRLSFIKENFYDKFSEDVLRCDNRPVIALGFGGQDSNWEATIRAAESLGFHVVNGKDAEGGGAAFVGITMDESDQHRITPLSAVVSPGVDVTGKGTILNLGDNSRVCDSFSGSKTVSETILPRKCVAVSPPILVPHPIQYYRGTLLAKGDGVSSGKLCGFVTNCEDEVFRGCDPDGSFLGLKFSEERANCTIRVGIEVHRFLPINAELWITFDQHRQMSTSEYDRQWSPILQNVSKLRPTFITIASFNSWEEGTAIEENSLVGARLLDRTAYWAALIKKLRD